MGNCLKSPTSDDITLLAESQADRDGHAGDTEQDREPLPPYQVPVFYPMTGQTLLASQLTEDEQVRIAKWIGLLQHLPRGVYNVSGDSSQRIRECVICMIDFTYGDPIRLLPCMHIYHVDCIDDWLTRSFTCPSCMEPVDVALLTSYENS
ncbi:RING finger protein 11-like [Brienomyrus brachyistius]|uniref:RING finger protein 11-like n=1 Tax=Brienomyrus brachyistius TaxID=42636 RepID=UPI0020B40156|nr:RING finger protein 11-like [Brienomyrus brachyistius]